MGDPKGPFSKFIAKIHRKNHSCTFVDSANQEGNYAADTAANYATSATQPSSAGNSCHETRTGICVLLDCTFLSRKRAPKRPKNHRRVPPDYASLEGKLRALKMTPQIASIALQNCSGMIILILKCLFEQSQ